MSKQFNFYDFLSDYDEDYNEDYNLYNSFNDYHENNSLFNFSNDYDEDYDFYNFTTNNDSQDDSYSFLSNTQLNVIPCSKVTVIDHFDTKGFPPKKTIALDANGKVLTSSLSSINILTTFDLKYRNIQPGIQFKVISQFYDLPPSHAKSNVILVYDPASTTEVTFEITNNFKIIRQD